MYIDPNSIIRMSYDKFDKLERVIKNNTVTKKFKDKKGNVYQLLECHHDNKTIIMRKIK